MNDNTMQKRSIDPWAWGPRTNSVQAVEVSRPASTLYCSGLVAMDADGVPSSGDMRAQLEQTFQNLEELIRKSGYECADIVRLNVFTTSVEVFFSTCSALYADWIGRHGLKQATTLIEVKGLFAGLGVELEATAVR